MLDLCARMTARARCVTVRPNGAWNLFPVVITNGQGSMPDGQVYGRIPVGSGVAKDK